jgi:cardiolipin synthase
MRMRRFRWGKNSIFTFYLLISLIIFSGGAEGCTQKELPVEDITVVVDRDYYPVFHDIVSNATGSVHGMIYVARFTEGSLVERLLEDLENAHKRGIEVKILFEQSGYDSSLNETNRAFMDTLQKLGISARWDSPNITTHAKFVVVDSLTVLIGSTNWTLSALERNNETNVLIKNREIATEFERYFEKLWEEK